MEEVLGTIQATADRPDTEESMAPEVAVNGGAPVIIYKDEAHVDKVLQGPIGSKISAIVRKKTGVEFVAYGEVWFRHLLSKRQVTPRPTRPCVTWRRSAWSCIAPRRKNPPSGSPPDRCSRSSAPKARKPR